MCFGGVGWAWLLPTVTSALPPKYTAGTKMAARQALPAAAKCL